jgi:hypothetical protein
VAQTNGPLIIEVLRGWWRTLAERLLPTSSEFAQDVFAILAAVAILLVVFELYGASLTVVGVILVPAAIVAYWWLGPTVRGRGVLALYSAAVFLMLVGVLPVVALLIGLLVMNGGWIWVDRSIAAGRTTVVSEHTRDRMFHALGAVVIFVVESISCTARVVVAQLGRLTGWIEAHRSSALVTGVALAVAAGAFFGGRAVGGQPAPVSHGGQLAVGFTALDYRSPWRENSAATSTFSTSNGDAVLQGGLNAGAAGPLFRLGILANVGVDDPVQLIFSGATRSPTPDTVRLGGLYARRYQDIHADQLVLPVLVHGLVSPTTLYLLRTTRGTVVMTCSGRQHSSCDSLASSVRLESGVRSLPPLGPARRVAVALNALLVRFNKARQLGRAQLKQAKTPAEQRTAAMGLAASYTTAESRAGQLPTGVLERTALIRLAAAFEEGAAASRNLADAVRSRSEQGFLRATRQLHQADEKLAAGIRSFAQLGYVVRPAQ